MRVVGRGWLLLLVVGWLVVAGCGDREDLVIVTDLLPEGQVGVAYSTTIEVRGDADEFGVVFGNLPPTLELSDTGVLSGTPQTAGTFTFTIEVFDLLDGDILDRTAQGFFIVINP